MPNTSARTALQRLADARAAIDRWDSEFTPAPWHLYTEATDALATLEPREHDHIIDLLADPYLRCEAAYACGFLKLRDARPALLDGLRDAEQRMRDVCAEALLAISPETTLQSIVDAGAAVNSHVVDRAALAAIDSLGAGVVRLLDEIGHAPSPSNHAWTRLYDLYREAVNPVLERRVRRETFDWVYGVHLIVLDRGGDAWVRKAFQQLATHPDSRLAQLASKVLAKVGDASSLDTMVVALRTATHPWLRSSTVHGILELGRASQVPVAERVIALASSSADEQRTLMLGLAALGEAAWEAQSGEAITRAIREALVHPDREVVAAAIRAAHAHGLASLAPDVIGTLAHPRYYDNEMNAARTAFIEWAPDASLTARVAAVERALADTADSHDVDLAARAMVGLDVGQHAALIARAFADGDYRLQNAAAHRLRGTGSGDERDALLELVKQGPADVTAEALRALERVGDGRGLAWLARRAKDPDRRT